MELFINTIKNDIGGMLKDIVLSVLVNMGVVKLIPLEHSKRKVRRAKINV